MPEMTVIIVPYDDDGEVSKLLKRFCSGFDGATDGTTTEYHAYNLRVSDLVLALLDAELYLPPKGDGKGRTD